MLSLGIEDETKSIPEPRWSTYLERSCNNPPQAILRLEPVVIHIVVDSKYGNTILSRYIYTIKH